MFYLAVLPQFLPDGAASGWLLALALSYAVLCSHCSICAPPALGRVRVVPAWSLRRAVDTVTGAALLGFSAVLASGDA